MQELAQRLRDAGAPPWAIAAVLLLMGGTRPLLRMIDVRRAAREAARVAQQQERIGSAWAEIVEERRQESARNRADIEELRAQVAGLHDQARSLRMRAEACEAAHTKCTEDLATLRRALQGGC